MSDIRGDLCKASWDGWPDNSIFSRAMKEIDSLTKQLESARKDSERYRLLLQQTSNACKNLSGEGYQSDWNRNTLIELCHKLDKELKESK